MNDQTTQELIEKLISSDLSKEETIQINEILINSREAREYYLEQTKFEIALQENYMESAPFSFQTEDQAPLTPTKHKHWYIYPIATAACIMLALWLTQLSPKNSSDTTPANETTQTPTDENDYDIGPIAGSGHFGHDTSTTQHNLKQTWLDQLGTSHFSEGWGKTQINVSVGNEPFVVAGIKYYRGIGTHAESEAIYKLSEQTLNFRAAVGISDSVIGKEWKGRRAGCHFRVVGNGRTIWESGLMKAGDPVRIINIPLKGITELRLIVDKGPDGITFDHANWMDASFLYIGKPPVPQAREVDHSSFILTPKPGPTPKINGAKIIGGTPGKPFLFRIPTTGERPITFQAQDLPDELQLDEKNGILKGNVPARGEYPITLHAKNDHGTTKKVIKLISGDTLSLTPPMGWNSWYCWSESISAKKIEDIAQALVDKGLADHGWTYVNIDDCWQGERGGPLNAIQGNSRFPDMEKLCNNVHRHGLKIGIYSTPWISSYAGFIGGSSPDPRGFSPELHVSPKSRHQPDQVYGRWPSLNKLKLDRVGKYWLCDQDAAQWAKWGIDYVKYDWNPNDIPTTKRLLNGLKMSDRDMIFSISNNASFEKAKDISELANLWRTGGDIHDDWGSILRNGFNKSNWAPYSRPGHWNDPDMLQVGMRGLPNSYVHTLRPTRLTPHEQYSHMSLWCLLSAPLILSCDVANMDDFTLNLLTNDEVIAINQDPLGQSASPVNGDRSLWLKPLEDGSYALGIFNLTPQKRTITVDKKSLDQLNLTKVEWQIRDLWRQKDLGKFSSVFTTEIESHGVTLVRISNSQ